MNKKQKWNLGIDCLLVDEDGVITENITIPVGVEAKTFAEARAYACEVGQAISRGYSDNGERLFYRITLW